MAEVETTFGISIVGMGQAGKTTLRNSIADAWESLHPGAQIYDFSNSNGFRGFTAHVVESSGLEPQKPATESEAHLVIEGYLDREGIDEDLLDSFYTDPKPMSVLRSVAVNSMVEFVGEHQMIRPKINGSGARFLSRVVREPEVVGLEQTPELVILDARNAEECELKFKQAHIKQVGSFILVCREEVVVARVADVSQLSNEERLAQLKKRNEVDRSRSVGKMSLPQDFPLSLALEGRINEKDYDSLYRAGFFMGSCPTKHPLSIDTEFTTPEDVAVATPWVLKGARAATKVRVRVSADTAHLPRVLA